MHTRHRLLLPLLPLSPAAAQAVQAAPLRIGSWSRDHDASTRTVEALLKAAYAELGQRLFFVELPLRRALAELLDGRLDGNLMRTRSVIAEREPRLVRVDPPLMLLDYWAYRLQPQPAPQQWQDLAGRRVAMLRGLMAIERQLPASARRVEAASVPELRRLVERGVAELALSSESRWAPPLLPTLERRVCGMAHDPLHHVLRADHGELAQRLGALLALWQRNGRFESLLRVGLR